MPISPAASSMTRSTSFDSFEGSGPSRVPTTRTEAIDTFVRSSSDPFSNTPITDAFVDTIQSPSKPVSEKLALVFLTPILIPITVVLDVVLWPLIKVQQVTNWVKSKFS